MAKDTISNIKNIKKFYPGTSKIQKAIEAANHAVLQQSAQQQREEFARRLHAIRVAVGLSQRELAEKAGTKQALITRYETAGAMPRPKMIERLAAALGVPTSMLDISCEMYHDFEFHLSMFRKQGITIRKVQHGLYALSLPGCPEVTLTLPEAEELWEYCSDETTKEFSSAMKKYFVGLFVQEAYKKMAAKTKK